MAGRSEPRTKNLEPMGSQGSRRAVAVVVRREDGRILAVRRPDGPGEELPGVWGLPATTVRSGETDDDAIARIGRDKLGVRLERGPVVGHGEQARDGYTLRMAVYEGALAGEPRLPERGASEGTLYDAIDWLPAASFREAASRGSLCCAVLLERVG